MNYALSHLLHARAAAAIVIAALCSTTLPDTAGAHHSFSMFDRSKSVVLDGTVKSVHLINPHSWFVITAAGKDGVVRDWTIEGPSPNILIRQGWKHTDVTAGDRISLTCNPSKDGSAGGMLVLVRLAGGRELSGLPVGLPVVAPVGPPPAPGATQ